MLAATNTIMYPHDDNGFGVHGIQKCTSPVLQRFVWPTAQGNDSDQLSDAQLLQKRRASKQQQDSSTSCHLTC